MKMYPADYMALRQKYLSMPPGVEKSKLGTLIRSMQAEAENEYDSATGTEPGDAQPQMVEIGNDIISVPSNVLIQSAPKKPQPALVSAAIQYKQPGKGQGRLRPSPLAMAEINAKAVARGEPPPYTDNQLVKAAVQHSKAPEQPVIADAGLGTLPEIQVNAPRKPLPDIIPQEQPVQEAVPQQVDSPQGPAPAESPGRQGIPQLPGADQRIADIEERIKNGTATVNDQLMLQMLKGQANRQQQQMLPPGYGDMGMARAGMAGLVNPGYKDVEDDAKQFLPSLIQMLGNLNRINRG